MDYISDQYKSDEEVNSESSVVPKKISVEIAPKISENLQKDDTKYVKNSALQIFDNPTADILNAPIKGPKLPNKEFFENPCNNIQGHIVDYSIDSSAFEEQFHTYKNFGYAKDPSDATSSAYIGDEEKFKEFGGSTVFSENALKKRKYKRPQREKRGDPNDIDDYKGPWAKFKEDEDVVEEMREHQKRMKEAYEAEKRGEKTGEKKADAKSKESVKAKDTKETDKKNEIVDDCAKETTVFEYIEEFDYMSRSYMHCPHEFRNNEPEHKCFIPTKRVHTWRGHTDAVTAIRFIPKTGHVLLSASTDKSLKLWDVNGHRRCLRTMNGHSKGVKDIEFTADGRKFMSVSHDQWIKIWDTETGKVVSRFTSGVATLTARFCPANENEFLAGQADKLVVGWDVRQKEIVQKYDDHLKAVNAVAFIDGGRKFVSASDDKKILIWEYGIPVVVNHISEPYMSSVPFITTSPDGEWFLGQSMDNSVTVYYGSDKRKNRKRRYIGHSSYGYACQVDVSPDGKFIMSGDSDGKVFFWDWKTKKIYKRLNAHSKVTIGAIWHPVHPSKVATCSWDHTIKYWD